MPNTREVSTMGLMALMLGLGCGDGTEGSAPAPSDEPKPYCAPESELQIIGGQDSSTYLGLSERQQRSIGLVSREEFETHTLGCTGTMIAPGWVITAAHCAPPDHRPLFFSAYGESSACLGTWPSKRVARHASLDLLLIELEGTSTEFCRLFSPLPVLDASLLRPGVVVELAGFGLTRDGTHGVRQFVAEVIAEARNDRSELVVDGLGRTGACTGDSGGPLLFRAGDGSVAIAGALTGGSADCVGQDPYVRLDLSDAFFAPMLEAGRCQPAECGTIDAVGRCFGPVAAWCDGAQLRGETCGSGDVCGWHPEALGFRCVPPQSACPGFDHYGRCHLGARERCVGGASVSDDCTASGASCVLDAHGVATCASTP